MGRVDDGQRRVCLRRRLPRPPPVSRASAFYLLVGSAACWVWASDLHVVQHEDAHMCDTGNPWMPCHAHPAWPLTVFHPQLYRNDGPAYPASARRRGGRRRGWPRGECRRLGGSLGALSHGQGRDRRRSVSSLASGLSAASWQLPYRPAGQNDSHSESPEREFGNGQADRTACVGCFGALWRLSLADIGRRC